MSGSGAEDDPRREIGRARYGRYTGGPDPLAPPVDLQSALAEIGDDVLAGTSPRRALKELLRRGTGEGDGRRPGLDELAARAHARRRELLERGRLTGTLEQIKQLLDEAVLAERKVLARALDDDARFQEMQIGALSDSPAKAVSELSEYRWRSAEAAQKYRELTDLLGKEMLDERFAGMKQALEQATDEDKARVREMLAALNALLDAHSRGEDTAQQFEDFLDEYGDFFPDRPDTVEELIDQLARRSAAAQRLRNSLTDDQRAELDALASQAFGDPQIGAQLAALDEHMRAARPGEDWDGAAEMTGDDPLGLGAGAAALAEVGDLDELIDQLAQEYPGARMHDIDPDEVARLLGEESAVDARTLQELERALVGDGLLARGADGDLRLSPAALRRLGKAALADATGAVAGPAGGRRSSRAGRSGEPTGASRAWEYGDTAAWDVTRTVTNAVLRTGRMPARLTSDDIEVVETEHHERAVVALLVDISFSMVMDGRWVPMKRTALALEHLIRTRFRGDALEIIAFGRLAHSMRVDELAGLPEIFEQGTNLHHGLLLAERHLRRHRDARPVVLVVTDGEPTAHLEPDGEAYFAYPPQHVTLAKTVDRLDALTALGAQTTFFRLGDDPGLARLIDALARRAGGRVVAPEADGLGAAVVGDYLRRRG